jgi:Major Facilitator Superfamily
MIEQRPEKAAAHPTRTVPIPAMGTLAYSPLQTALPAFRDRYGVSTSTPAWLLTSFLLSSAISTPLLGRLGDMYGEARMLLVARLVFGTGILLSAVAGSFAVVLASRVVRGRSSRSRPSAPRRGWTSPERRCSRSRSSPCACHYRGQPLGLGLRARARALRARGGGVLGLGAAGAAVGRAARKHRAHARARRLDHQPGGRRDRCGDGRVLRADPAARPGAQDHRLRVRRQRGGLRALPPPRRARHAVRRARGRPGGEAGGRQAAAAASAASRSR